MLSPNENILSIPTITFNAENSYESIPSHTILSLETSYKIDGEYEVIRDPRYRAKWQENIVDKRENICEGLWKIYDYVETESGEVDNSKIILKKNEESNLNNVNATSFSC